MSWFIREEGNSPSTDATDKPKSAGSTGSSDPPGGCWRHRKEIARCHVVASPQSSGADVHARLISSNEFVI